MTFKGINFRQSAVASGITDSADDTYWHYAGAEVYPAATRAPFTGGFGQVSAGAFAAGGDRSGSGVDARLAGICESNGTIKFRIALPSGAGTYNLRAAMGDRLAARGGMSIAIYDSDGTTQLYIKTGISTGAADSFADINGTIHTAANWPANNTTTTVTFTGSTAYIQWGANTYVNHIAFEPAGDVTPPTLTSPTGTATGSTTATGGATTNEANGTLYTCWTTTSTTPTAAQVKAGQNSAGAAAAAAASSAVTSTGAKTNNATGLTASTTYYAHSMHEDAATNQSNVVTSASFTTSASDTTPPTLTSPVGTGGTLTCAGSVSTNEANGTLYVVFTGSATAPTAVQVEAGQDATGSAAPRAVSQAVSATGSQTIASGSCTAGTRYAHYMHKDAAGNRSTVASSSSFVVAAGSTATITTPPLKNNTGTLLASISGWTVNVYNPTTGALVVQKTSLTTSAGGVLTIADAALSTGTTYSYEAVHATYGRRLPTGAAA